MTATERQGRKIIAVTRILLELSNLVAVATFFSVLTGLVFTRNPEFEFKNSKNETLH